MNITINSNGLAQIRAALEANHKPFLITDARLAAWASEAEESYAAGNGAGFEISPLHSLCGRPVVVDITPDGYDVERLEHCPALDHTSVEAIVELINDGGTAMSTAEAVAGEYAWDAALEGAETEVMAMDLEAHLDYLFEAGAQFDYSGALEIAKAWQAQSLRDKAAE